MSFLVPTITDVNRPYWEGLAGGALRFQRCPACGNSWLPARPHCPACLSAETEWRNASGRAKVLSWVVYHTAYADHLKARIPYDVTLVELEEGPRLLTNVVNSDAGRLLSQGAPVTLAIEIEEGVAIPRFQLENTEEPRNE